jgi:hypothetical protein
MSCRAGKRKVRMGMQHTCKVMSENGNAWRYGGGGGRGGSGLKGLGNILQEAHTYTFVVLIGFSPSPLTPVATSRYADLPYFSQSLPSLCGKMPTLFFCLLRVIGSNPLLPRYKTRNVDLPHCPLSLSSLCVASPHLFSVVLIGSNSPSPAITAGLSTFLTAL